MFTIKKGYKIILFFILFVIIVSVYFYKSSIVKITLDSNSSTGYAWEYKISDEKVLKLQDEKFIGDKREGHIVGVGGKNIYTFKALSKGNATVTFTYQRPNSKPIYVYEYNYSVDNFHRIKKTGEKKENREELDK